MRRRQERREGERYAFEFEYDSSFDSGPGDEEGTLN